MSIEIAIQNLADAINNLAGANRGVKPVAAEVVEAVKEAVTEKPKVTKAKAKAEPKAEEVLGIAAETEEAPEEEESEEASGISYEDYVAALQDTLRKLTAIAAARKEVLPVQWAKDQIRTATGGKMKDEVAPEDYATIIAKFKKLVA